MQRRRAGGARSGSVECGSAERRLVAPLLRGLPRAGRFLRDLRLVEEVALAFVVDSRNASARFQRAYRVLRLGAVLALVLRLALGQRLSLALAVGVHLAL